MPLLKVNLAIILYAVRSVKASQAVDTAFGNVPQEEKAHACRFVISASSVLSLYLGGTLCLPQQLLLHGQAQTFQVA